MNPHLIELLTRTDDVMYGRANGWHAAPELVSPSGEYHGVLHVGVDLGTAYTVLMVLDETYRPIAGAYQFAQIVRDGLVVDFVGAVALLRQMKQQVERKLGFELKSAASSYPPGVPQELMERIRTSAFTGDPMLAMPMLGTPGYEVARTKESRAPQGAFPL